MARKPLPMDRLQADGLEQESRNAEFPTEVPLDQG